MKISMYVEFQILKNGRPLTSEDVTDISLGGYNFVIDGDWIPFDWDACEGEEENSIFAFTTGRGPFYNEFELTDCYDDEYVDLGLTREDITAEFLASVVIINEFHVNFEDAHGNEIDLGCNDDATYRIILLKMSFEDVETGQEYSVDQYVLNEYNGRLVRVK